MSNLLDFRPSCDAQLPYESLSLVDKYTLHLLNEFVEEVQFSCQSINSNVYVVPTHAVDGSALFSRAAMFTFFAVDILICIFGTCTNDSGTLNQTLTQNFGVYG